MQFIPIQERRPKSVGGIPIFYNNAAHPHVSNVGIHLPALLKDAELCLIVEGMQGLFVASRGGQRHIHWFGRDERSPFVTELSPELWPDLAVKGEEEFFEALKPPVIRFLEKVHGKRGTERQGDICFRRLPYGWRDIIRMSGSCPLYRRGKIFRTRHRHSGLRLWGYLGDFVSQPGAPSEIDSGLTLIASGWLRAPNHAPRHLGGPHALSRSQKIIRPD